MAWALGPPTPLTGPVSPVWVGKYIINYNAAYCTFVFKYSKNKKQNLLDHTVPPSYSPAGADPNPIGTPRPAALPIPGPPGMPVVLAPRRRSCTNKNYTLSPQQLQVYNLKFDL